MTLKRILQAAVNSMITGHHSPHCYRAHVLGKGYVNDGSKVYDRADYLRQLECSAQCEVDNMNFAPSYAEPGYTQPDKAVLFADWNVLPKELGDILEQQGYICEWSDEWSTCEDCDRAVRTSGDSYSWMASYVMVDDCSILCKDCMLTDMGFDEDGRYTEHLLNNANIADTFDVDWTAEGFKRMNADHYEHGWHPGQNDKPKEIAKHVPKGYDFLFSISSVGQFDVHFDCWIRLQETDEEKD